MKKFLIKISYTVLPVWLLFVGTVLYISLYAQPRVSGDLGTLGCIPFGHEYDRMLEKECLQDVLFKTTETTAELKDVHATVLTIGDSFSQLANSGYQNYMARQGVDVVNCRRDLYINPMLYAYQVLNMGLIDSSRVKYLIVESVERDFPAYVFDFDAKREQTLDLNPAPAEAGEAADGGGAEQGHTYSWSMSRARDVLLYQIGRDNPIFTAKLDKDYFSSDEPSKLYFYKKDVREGFGLHAEKAKSMYDALCAKAAEKGIQLLLMVAVDKYDLYQKHIIDNSYPAKTTNEDIENTIGTSQRLVMTKRLLMPMVDKGEKDVFKFNDTHWSYKASQVVADELVRRMSLMPN